MCTSIFKIFGVACRKANQKGLLTFPKNKRSAAFVDDGFSIWKKATQRFREHEMHHEALMKLAAHSGNTSISTQLNSQHEQNQKSDIYINMLTEVDKLLRIYFCIPVTSATAEHSFSLLQRIKHFLRSIMCQT